MLDIIGAISLTSLFALCSAALIGSAPLPAPARLRMVAAAVLWFGTAAVLAALGVFAAAPIGTFTIGVAVLAPIALWLWAARRSSTVRAIAFGTPLSVLIVLHAGRILGLFFVLLFGDGRLPPTFALIAGWGDIAVAVFALPLAWAAHRRIAGWRPLVLAWNSFAFLDLVTAVTLGVGSAPDTPARFIFETPGPAAMSFLPWLLVPGLLVPMYLLTHIAIFVRLARAGARRAVPADSPRLARQHS